MRDRLALASPVQNRQNKRLPLHPPRINKTKDRLVTPSHSKHQEVFFFNEVNNFINCFAFLNSPTNRMVKFAGVSVIIDHRRFTEDSLNTKDSLTTEGSAIQWSWSPLQTREPASTAIIVLQFTS